MQTSKEEIKVEYLSSSGVYKTPFSFIILIQLFVGGMVLVLVNLWFWSNIYYLLGGKQFYQVETGIDWIDAIFEPNWTNWILLPLNIYGNLFLFSFSIILVSIGIDKLLNKMCPPSEGVFERGSKEWKYMHRRYWNAYFPIWLARALPLPWADIVVYRFFGVKIGRNVVAYEGYIDPKFVEIGDHTMTSLHICVFSHLLYHDKVIIQKVKIGENCIVGPQTIISPGTVMHDGAILGVNSYTWLGQELEGDLIHLGLPVSFTLTIQSLEESQAKAEKTIKSTEGVDEN